MLEFAVLCASTILVVWRIHRFWSAAALADLFLPYGPKGWPFGPDWWCKLARCIIPGSIFIVALALNSLSDVAPATASTTIPASVILALIALGLTPSLWWGGRPAVLVPPLLRGYDC